MASSFLSAVQACRVALLLTTRVDNAEADILAGGKPRIAPIRRHFVPFRARGRIGPRG